MCGVHMIKHKKLQGIFALSASILLQVIGTITLFSLNTNIWTLFVLTAIVTSLVFLTILRGRIQLIFMIIRKHPGIVFLINLCMMGMILVLFACLSLGLSPACYSIVFSISLGVLVSTERRSIWLVPFGALLVAVFFINDHKDLMAFSLLGPMACYGILKLTNEICCRYQVSTSELMVLRYAWIIIPAFLSIPWLPPLTTDPMTSSFWCSLVMVVIGFNILPIFFSQMSTVTLGHQATAVGVAFLPFLTFIAEYEVLGTTHLWLTPLSILLAVLLVLSILWPRSWRSFFTPSLPSQPQ